MVKAKVMDTFERRSADWISRTGLLILGFICLSQELGVHVGS